MTDTSGNIIRFPGEAVAEVEAAAALWLARLTSGSLTLGELAEFEYWRAASPDRDRAYRELEAMWDRLGAGSVSHNEHHRVAGEWRRPYLFPGWSTRLVQIAAAIVVLVMGTQYLSNWRYDYHTAPGEIRRVALADGSVVSMKGGTALDVDITDKGARVIKLARGEAFFEVRHDAARPFTVAVGSGVVRDIGTGFSVMRNGSAATVAVEHGVVAVEAAGQSEILTAGEQVSLNPYDMSRKQRVATSLISPWQRGLYIAEGKPLGELLRDLDDYHAGRIIVTSRALAARRVNAVVRLAHVDALLDALNQTSGVRVDRWGPLTIVSDRQN